MALAVRPGFAGEPAAPGRDLLRVVLDKAYPPYSFLSDQGEIQGILVDQWRAWEKTTGVKVEIHALDWADALAGMRQGDFDVIGCIVETEERRAYFDFSAPFAVAEVPVFFRSEISGITNLDSLKGFPIAVKTGDQHIAIFKAKGLGPFIPFRSHDEIVDAARRRRVSVFIFDRPSAHYHLNKAGIEGEFRQSEPVFRDELRWAVHKGDSATLQLVTNGFKTISPDDLRRIDEKWFGRTINKYGRFLTYAEYTVAAAALLIAGLIGWNHSLRRAVLQRTAALREREKQLHALVDQLHHVREDEAKRIARELHDDLGQRLTALSLEIGVLEAKLTGATRVEKSEFGRIRSTVADTIRIVQNISSELRLGQLDVLGLSAAVGWQLNEFARNFAIPCKAIRLDEVANLSSEQRTAVYRILQEALTNIARHACATLVEVSLEQTAEAVSLRVRDNGRGITAQEASDPKSIGLLGIRERAQNIGARVAISGQPGVGTTVAVTIPCADSGRAPR